MAEEPQRRHDPLLFFRKKTTPEARCGFNSEIQRIFIRHARYIRYMNIFACVYISHLVLKNRHYRTSISCAQRPRSHPPPYKRPPPKGTPPPGGLCNATAVFELAITLMNTRECLRSGTEARENSIPLFRALT